MMSSSAKCSGSNASREDAFFFRWSQLTESEQMQAKLLIRPKQLRRYTENEK